MPLLELWGLTYWHNAAIVEKATEEVRESVFSNEFLVVYDNKLIRNDISQKSACDDNFVKLSVAKFTDHIKY